MWQTLSLLIWNYYKVCCVLGLAWATLSSHLVMYNYVTVAEQSSSAQARKSEQPKFKQCALFIYKRTWEPWYNANIRSKYNIWTYLHSEKTTSITLTTIDFIPQLGLNGVQGKQWLERRNSVVRRGNSPTDGWGTMTIWTSRLWWARTFMSSSRVSCSSVSTSRCPRMTRYSINK